MTKHWQELIPVDRYMVSSAGLLHDYDRKILTLLYQPLIGPVCVSLYMTLWSEIEANRLWSHSSTHYSLMNTIGLNLNEIFEARTKLEGIGLLKVYRKKMNDEKQFIYELRPPLTPEQFFTDGMLNIYLYKKIGKAHFNRLKKFFCDDRIQVDEFEEVTKSFSAIFTSDHMDSLYMSDEAADTLEPESTQQFIGRPEGEEPEGFESTFDFTLFFSGLKSSLAPKKAFTSKVTETISKLAFLYGINPLQMQGLVIGSVNMDNEIDLKELRKSAQNWYQIEYNKDMPSLTERVQPVKHRTQHEEPKTQEQEYIRHLETTSPRDRLMQLSGGAEPSANDMQIIEGVMLNQNLRPGVINVLIEYVMLKTDMKLTKAYVEKIASHWTRKNVSTVTEAMELAKSEHRQYQEWAKAKKEGRNSNKKATRTEPVPEWLNKEETETAAVVDDSALIERKRQLEEKMKNLKNRG
ncbi:replication initiation and membrane attachment family protein [Peribacillus psychrosaccharolyticus]|uniref:Replication initiation and membrane attachment family protein n=1 Tax=Peribacillus psychrosaccharolyticus TaxID=1407 RepID=A0A974RZI1_PERPY|nr:replication initiation and membrane attachment family protein [Peribacillus psychrosaccharolyticus]MEC2054676.1 replication initiation and membrane attachment family protein [Peribacillus psychrosaccharolyticus]MED3744097.1 replication initiation and membrane attachment family protein [Peribacillus psychrosaccharolyticus]QQS99591.1 replication initiation and membrane attachment family protein [Peribacillus psychrosaccharolyticus]